MSERSTLGNRLSMTEIDAGIIFKKVGINYLIEETQQIQPSLSRFETIVQQFGQGEHRLTPGAKFLIGLVLNEMVLTVRDLQSIASRDSQIYRMHELTCVSWPRANGWRDIRLLSEETLEPLSEASFNRPTVKDWAVACSWLATIVGYQRAQVWQQFLGDATSWWSRQTSYPFLLHAVNLQPFQPPKRAALARALTGLPEKADRLIVSAPQDHCVFAVHCASGQSQDIRSLEDLASDFGEIVRKTSSKPQARENMIKKCLAYLPHAQAAGPAQTLIVAGLRYVVETGGVRGNLLAASSIYTYVTGSLVHLAKQLVSRDIYCLTADDWYQIHLAALEKVPDSRKGQAAAFFEALHGFFVLVGCEPLRLSLSGPKQSRPPDESLIHAHEMLLALEYIAASDGDSQTKLQARLALLLAFHVPMRVSELWTIRIEDIQFQNGCTLTVYPRIRDGGSKSSASRLQHDIADIDVISELAKFRELRIKQHACDSDYLFGAPGFPEVTHEKAKTISLIQNALRWATGNALASFHDLRHACISLRGLDAFARADMQGDISVSQVLSASCGHSSFHSTCHYLHFYFWNIKSQTETARPNAWLPRKIDRSGISTVDEGFVDDKRAELPKAVHICSKNLSSELGVKDRLQISYWICAGYPTNSIASIICATPDVVEKVVIDLGRSLDEFGISRNLRHDELRPAIFHIRNHFELWARASRQPKHDLLITQVERDLKQQQDKELYRLVAAWLPALKGADCFFSNRMHCETIISYFRKAGYTKNQLLLLAPPSASQTDLYSIEKLVTIRKLEKLRAGQRHPRFQLIDSSHDPACASSASNSMKGIHWVIICLNSVLLSRS